jgi:hypothetical protein
VRAAPGAQPNNSLTVPSGGTLQITDLILQNVTGGVGRALVQRVAAAGQPTQTLLEEDLQTLTDMEYQFGSPIVLTAGEKLMLTVQCSPNQDIAPTCDVNLYYTGPLTVPAASAGTTIP